MVARGPRGERVLAAADLFQSYLTTKLAADEMLVEVRLPAMPAGAGFAFEEFARRHGDFAIVGIAAHRRRARAGACTPARLATAGAGPVPVRLRAAEEILEREALGEAAIEAAARRAAELVDSRSPTSMPRPTIAATSLACSPRALAAPQGASGPRVSDIRRCA